MTEMQPTRRVARPSGAHNVGVGTFASANDVGKSTVAMNAAETSLRSAYVAVEEKKYLRAAEDLTVGGEGKHVAKQTLAVLVALMLQNRADSLTGLNRLIYSYPIRGALYSGVALAILEYTQAYFWLKKKGMWSYDS